jgi:hypothetical protein
VAPVVCRSLRELADTRQRIVRSIEREQVPAGQGGIFLSYRRQDAAPYARLLKSELSERIPGARVFMDLDSIEPDLDFAEVIREAPAPVAVASAAGTEFRAEPRKKSRSSGRTVMARAPGPALCPRRAGVSPS